MNLILLVYINAFNLLDMGYFFADIDLPIVLEKVAFKVVACHFYHYYRREEFGIHEGLALELHKESYRLVSDRL